MKRRELEQKWKYQEREQLMKDRAWAIAALLLSGVFFNYVFEIGVW